MRSPKRSMQVATSALAMVATSLLLPAWAHGANTPGPTIGLSAGLAGKTSLESQHYSYAVAPGSRITDSLTVFNLTATTVPIDLFAVDMITAANGQHAPAPRAPRPRDAGSWVKLTTSHLDLKPHQVISVPFSLAVPTHVTPGDHLGAVVASYLGPAPATGLRIEERVALTMAVRVLGTLGPRLTAGPLTLHDDNTFSLNVRNVGNALVTLKGSLKVNGTVTALSPRDLYVIPGGQATLYARWVQRPWLGEVNAQAHIVGTLDGHAPVSADTPQFHQWIIPWETLVSGAAVVAACVLIWAASRSSRRRWTQKRREERELIRRTLAVHRATKADDHG